MEETIARRDGFILRRAQWSDAQAYYAQNYAPLDSETARLTGCKEAFTQEEVLSFFKKSIEERERVFLLIVSAQGRIVGECVINDIDAETRSANFRMALFHADARGKGLGTWACAATRDFAFEKLGLHRLSLDVYAFNPRAERVYEKCGFRREGVLRDAILDGARYADVILMAILEEEWKKLKGL